MIVANAQYFNLLADGWGELIPLLFIVGISLVSAIAKAFNKGDENSKSENEKTSRLIEMAKRYKEMRESGQQPSASEDSIPYAQKAKTPPKHTSRNISEWDRRQQEKKQQIARQRQQQTRPPRYVERQTPPQLKPNPPVNIPAAEPVRPTYKPPKIQTKPRPKRASQRTRKQPQQVSAAKTLKQPPVAAIKHSKTKKQAPMAQMTLNQLFRGKQSLKSAIVLKEILDKPIALRESW